jgi:hypothetical protein
MTNPSRDNPITTLSTEVNGTEIFVEFSQAPGLRQVSITPENMAQKSAEAVDKAMEIVRQMANKGMVALDALANKPTQVEMEFGVKFNAETGAIIAKAASEASLTVKFTWDRRNESS